jgi:hypothetical protein
MILLPSTHDAIQHPAQAPSALLVLAMLSPMLIPTSHDAAQHPSEPTPTATAVRLPTVPALIVLLPAAHDGVEHPA